VSALALAGTLLLAPRSQAVVFSASELIGGYTYSAEAEFTYDSVNNLLCIRLTNTAPAPVTSQGQTLSGLYFDVAGPLLTKYSAAVGVTSTIVNDVPNLDDSKIGQEWAFRNNIGTAEASFTDALYGISSTGLGLFAPGDRFDTSGNLAGPPSGSVGGDDFNLVPAVQSSFSGGGLDGTPFVQNSMLFKLNTPAGFVLDIRNVAFHYGSGQDFPTIVPGNGGPPTGVPEPGSLALLGGMAGAATLVFRRQRGR
jgi:hypothetical protein